MPTWTWTRGPLEKKERGPSEKKGRVSSSWNQPRQRLDRVLMKSDKLRSRSFDVIGRDSIAPYTGEDPMLVEEDGQFRTMSDHFGLLAVFQFRGNEVELNSDIQNIY